MAWTEGHRRLFEYLCEKTEPHQPDTLDGLQPLYQAVAHGCQAGLHERACADVYRDRILRGTGNDGFYSSRKLGAIGADLGAVACFFERPFSKLSPNLSPADQAWLLNEAAYSLRALGRLTEAVEPMRVSMDMDIEREEWQGAAIRAGNLSELELTLGDVRAAIADAEQSVTFADRSQDAFQRMGKRTTLADALHQAGDRRLSLRESGASFAERKATNLFAEAERLQAEMQPEYPRLYSLAGFRYCDLLLSGAERAAWRAVLANGGRQPTGRAADSAATAATTQPAGLRPPFADTIAECDHVTERATQTLEWATIEAVDLLSAALDHLTLGRAALYQAIFTQSQISNPKSKIHPHLAAAVDGLRASGDMIYFPRGLLTRAWYRALVGNAAGSAADLDEAWEIAQRGPMPLYQADVLLTRARLRMAEVRGQKSEVRGQQEDVLRQVRDELAEARRLIDKHGYHRRDEELADADAALASFQP